MEEAVVGAHRTLDALFEGLRTVLRTEPPDAAGRRLELLIEALETHFEQEDALYYPSIGALRPESRPTIRSIAEAHDRFRVQLERIGALLERGDGGGAVEAFEEFVREFSQHECQEEELVRSVRRAAPES